MKRSELWGSEIKEASQHAITTCLSLRKEDFFFLFPFFSLLKRNTRKKAECEQALRSHHPGTQKDAEEEKER